MYLSSESLLVILLVGIAAGWLAGQIVQGTGLGLIGDMVIGVVGAFIGDWLLPRFGIHTHKALGLTRCDRHLCGAELDREKSL